MEIQDSLNLLRVIPRIIHEYDVAVALGGAAELERFALAITELQKYDDGFYKTEIGPLGFYQRSKKGQNTQEAADDNGIYASNNYLLKMQQAAKLRAEQEVQEFMNAIESLRDESKTSCRCDNAAYSKIARKSD